MTLISASHLSKEYRFSDGSQPLLRRLFFPIRQTCHALKNVSFNIDRGETVAILGPNGAGKSTLIKILCGILAPTSGDLIIDGRIPSKHRMAYTREIGVVMGQKSLLYWDVPVIDSLLLFKEIYDLSEDAFQKNLRDLESILRFQDLLDRPVRRLSLGQRMRCELAASFLHLPKLLFLDEPTIGLDLPTKLALFEFLKRIQKQLNATVLLATHSLEEVEALCNRILVLNQGQLRFDGSTQHLRSKLPTRHVGFQCVGIRNKGAFEAIASKHSLSSNLGIYQEVTIPSTDCTQFLRALMEAAEMSHLTVREPTIDQSLQEYFL